MVSRKIRFTCNDNYFEQIIVTAIEAAMDHKPSHRELTSLLISELSEEIVASEDIAKGI